MPLVLLECCLDLEWSYGHFRFGIGNSKCHFDTEGSRDAPRIVAVSSDLLRATLDTPVLQLFVPVLIDELL